MGTIKFVPSGEMETREWFAAHIAEFDYNIVISRAGYPDYVLEDDQGKRYMVEAEYTSDNFIAHGHDPSKCDFVLCWMHTQELTLPVLELITRKMHQPNAPATYPRQYKRLPKKPVSKQGFYDALKGCKDEATEFIFAFADDVSACYQYLELIGQPRLELLRKSNQLLSALADNGFAGDRIHPYDLFKLFVSTNAFEFMSDTSGDVRHLENAREAISGLSAILGENVTAAYLET